MDTLKNEKKQQVGNGFKTNCLLSKTVASIVTVFFIFSGVPVPASFAAVVPVTTNETQQIVPVVTLEQANAKTPVVETPVAPSGSAIQNTNPLSSPTPAQTQATSPSVPAVPSGWMRAASNANFAYSVGPLVLDGVHYYQALQVMDLRTSKTQVVTKTISSQSRVLPEPFVVDISPNGSYVVYQIQSGSDGAKVVQIYNLRDKNYAENLRIEKATVQNIVFSGREVRISTTASATDKRPDGVYVVDLLSGADRFVPDVPVGWTRTASNENFAFRTRSSSEDSQSGFVLEVRDLMSRAVYTINEASAGDSQVSFCDVSRYGGVVIYSITSTTDRATRTVVQKLSDPSKSLTVPEKVTGIRCDIGNWVIILSLEDGSRLWIDGGALKVMPPPVPSGWTRATSNENFAFYIKSGAKVGSYTVQTLQVQDLRTGEIRDVVTTQPPASKTFSRYDVSLDGKAVIYEMNGSMTVLSITDATMKWSGVGIPKSISMDGDSVTFSCSDGTKVRIRTQTFQRILLPLPDGWTRAASNANYAFKVDGATGRYEQAIYVMDLLTGSSQTVAVRVGYSSPGYSNQDVDVSPNGEYVFYKEIPTSGAQKVIEAYSLAQKKVTGFVLVDYSYYTISKVAFVGTELWVSVVPNKISDKPAGVYILNLKDGSKHFVPDVPAGWTRAASNENFAFRIVSFDSYFRRLEVLDLNTGATKVIMQSYAGPSTGKSLKWVDVSPNGKYVLYTTESVSVGGKDFYVSSINDPSQTISFYVGRNSIEGVQYTDNAIEVQVGAYPSDGRVAGSYKVDLVTKTVVFFPSVPAGWTRATSNVNYAFHTQSGKQVGSYTVQTLQVQDLRTGEIWDVVSTQPPVITSFSRYDVSVDGNAVIYEMYGYMQVQKITDPATLWCGGGIPTSTVMGGDFVTFTYPDGTVAKVSTQTFQRVLLPVPAGWTLAASNANFAFSVQRAPDYPQHSFVLKVQNLLTGKIQEVGAAPAAYGQISLYDVSPDGSTVVYYAHTNTSMPGYEAYTVVKNLTDLSRSITILGVLTGMSFDASKSTVMLTMNDGSRHWVDLKTMKVIQTTVPPIIRQPKNNPFNKTRVRLVKVNPFNKPVAPPVKVSPFNKAK